MRPAWNEIKLLAIRLSLALATYPACKILFFIFNYGYFSDVSIPDFAAILLYGLRFDLSAMLMVNVLFILLHMVPFGFTGKKGYGILLKVAFIVPNSAALLANCMDIEYYKYTLKHTTADFFSLFSLGSDVLTMLPRYLLDFWYIAVIWIVLTVITSRLYNKTKNISGNSSEPRPLVIRSIYWLLVNGTVIALFIIGFRGGLQLRPIMPINASEYVSAKNIPLVLNTPFTIIKTIDLEMMEEKNYFTQDELKKTFDPVHQPAATANPSGKLNLCIIIMESFSSEYTSLGKRKSHTPFLDSLMQESLVFENGFANGKKSIEGIPAVLAGIPGLANESFITSAYCSNQFTSIAGSLKKKGYSTAFFHGGTNGTMGFDAFCGSAGFDKYHGRTEYNNDADYDGEWGIWDENFFQYTSKAASLMKEPFFTTLFSLSSHHPYGIPEKYRAKFNAGGHPILKTIRYADHSLKKFFESASKEKWFDNTLFVITSDHTGPSEDSRFSTSAGFFEIPIVLYRHNGNLKGRNSRLAQQIDILPTVLSYLHYDEPFFAFGNNLLDTVPEPFAVNYLGHVYQFLERDKLLQFDGNRTIALYDYKRDSLLKNNMAGKYPEEKAMESRLKAIIQIYHHSMIHNQLTVKTK